jgi:hypothetical protein
MAGVSSKSQAVVGAIATVGTLLLVLVLVGVVPLLPQEQVGICAGCPPGPTFVAGNPSVGICPSGGTFATRGCLAGDFVYNLTIETSTITFGEVLFHIETANNTVYAATGSYSGFSILTSTGLVAAHYQTVGGSMNMTTRWTYVAGTNATTPLTSLYTLVLDMGAKNPRGLGLSFVAMVTGAIPETAILPLP